MGLEHRLQQRVEIHGGGCTHVGLFFFQNSNRFLFFGFRALVTIYWNPNRRSGYANRCVGFLRQAPCGRRLYKPHLGWESRALSSLL
jgi:hypothetical protein